MTQRYHLLGASDKAIVILFDLLKEIYDVDVFVIYPNLENGPTPLMPVVEFPFELQPVGIAPPEGATVFLATPGPRNKRAIFNHFLEKHEITEDQYDRIVHEDAYVAGSARLAKGVLLEPGAVVSSQAQIGFSVFIKRNSSVGHHSVIGAFTDVNPGVTICGNTTIGSGCTIGAGTTIRDLVTIGENTVIGMGSVVLTDIPANCIAYGNPCKVIKQMPSKR